MTFSRRVAQWFINVHAWAYRVSGGRIGHHFGSLEQVLLYTTGRKTGQERITPLMVTPVDERLVLIASNGGAPASPAWFHNLVAQPDVRLQRGRTTAPMHARVATGGERDELWRAAVAANSGYAGYQTKTDREIPVVVLEPRTEH